MRRAAQREFGDALLEIRAVCSVDRRACAGKGSPFTTWRSRSHPASCGRWAEAAREQPVGGDTQGVLSASACARSVVLRRGGMADWRSFGTRASRGHAAPIGELLGMLQRWSALASPPAASDVTDVLLFAAILSRAPLEPRVLGSQMVIAGLVLPDFAGRPLVWLRSIAPQSPAS